MTDSSAVVLGFGPQPVDFFAKAAKVCGKDAVIDPDVARMAGANFAFGMPDALSELRRRLATGALTSEAAARKGTDASPAMVAWLANGERGMSSEALFTRLSGIQATDSRSKRDLAAHPSDPADLRRCRLMLDACPELAGKLNLARDLSKIWAALIDAWPELCALMDEETPTWRKAEGQFATRLYKRMKELGA